MKSKKIVALIVAFAAFMAVATSGLAAVTSTTTTYLNDKVEVTAVVEAEAGKEVTYLVADSDGDIVYIDQKTATGGTATFEYKIAKNKIPDLVTDVKLGTDGNVAVNGGTKELEFDKVRVTKDAGVESVKFYTESACATEVTDLTLGNADKLYAAVEVKETTHELVSVSINGNDQEVAAVYEVTMGDELVVTTKEKDVTPDIVVDEVVVDSSDIELDETDENRAYVEDTVNYDVKDFALKITGNPENAGIVVGDTFYEALKGGAAEYDPNKIYAVRIITKKGETITGSPVYNNNVVND